MSVELVELEPLPGRRLAVDAELTIGRQDCDVTVSSPQVSRRHAQLAPRGDSAEVTDLGSRNGTFVNGARVAGSQALRPGDKLRIGETTWEVAAVDAGAATELEARGDVPAPPPSGVRDVPAPAPAAVAQAAPAAPPPAPPQPAPVAAPAGGPGAIEGDSGPRASAARRVEATLICYAVVMLTAIAVVLYLATR
jgi:pSer/pThr/pTyr-binding forkhead associated (FHA) protein